MIVLLLLTAQQASAPRAGSLRALMDRDVTSVFLNEDDHAEPAYYQPFGTTASFACTVLRTAAAPGMGGDPTYGSSSSPRFLASRSALRTGLASSTGRLRDPQHGDKLFLPRTGQTATVQVVELEPGDGLHLGVSIATLDALTTGRRT